MPIIKNMHLISVQSWTYICDFWILRFRVLFWSVTLCSILGQDTALVIMY